MGTAPTFGYFQPSAVPDVATAETIRFMCGCIDGSAKNAAVQAIAHDAAARFGELGAFDIAAGRADTGVLSDADLARAVYWFARYSIKRLHHGEFKATVAAFPEKKQLLISPDVLLLSSNPQGDCSAFTMAICALLKCLGIGYELVAVAVNPEDPAIYSHVYPRAVLKDGTRLVLDAHAMPGPGDEVPAQDIFRKQVYDSHGTPVSDQPSGFRGLHMYEWRGGLGDLSAADLAALDSVDVSQSGQAANLDYGGSGATYTLYPSGSSGSSSGFNWGGEIANLLNQWTKIGGQVVAPQVTQTTSKAGTSITGPSSALTSLTSGLSASSSGWMTLLLIGGAIFVGVKLMTGSKN